MAAERGLADVLHAARNDIIKSAQDWIAEHKELVLPLVSPVEIGDSVPHHQNSSLQQATR
jgi:hypothetical protein